MSAEAPVLGLVTIGQAPRTDVTEDLQEALSTVAWVEHGALDGLDEAGIGALAPAVGEPPLVTRLADGGSVEIGHSGLEPLLIGAFDECIHDGAAAVLLICTGHFEPFDCPVPVHAAEQLAQGYVEERVDGRVLGVINPVRAQSAEAVARWSRNFGTTVVGAWADPYTATLSEIAEAGRAAVDRGAECLVLDCFGYTTEMGRAVEEASGIETFVTRTAAVDAAVRSIRAQGVSDQEVGSDRPRWSASR